MKKSILFGAALCLTLSVSAQAQKSTSTSTAKTSQPVKTAVKKTQGTAQPLQQVAPVAATQPQAAKSTATTGIKFCECSWATAVSRAKEEKKAIFVDAYASWCGPCKYMKKMVFTIAEVGEFYNKNFVNMEVDWEKAEAQLLRGKYPLRAFPTLMFFNPDTEQVVAVAEGALDGSNMIAFANYGLNQLQKNKKPNVPPPAAEPEPQPTPAPVAAPSVPAQQNAAPQEKGIMDKLTDWFKDIF